MPHEVVFADELLKQLPVINYIVFGALSSCGALIRYLWDGMRGASGFTISGLLLYLVFGFFVGNLIGPYVSMAAAYFGITADQQGFRDSLLLACGFAVREILEVVPAFIRGRLEKVGLVKADGKNQGKPKGVTNAPNVLPADNNEE